MRLVHITDPHLTSLDQTSFWRVRGKRKLGYLSWRRRRRFIHKPEVLERLLAAVHQEAPDQILVTGDLTQLGLPFEIEQAAAWLEALGPPERVIVVPGNHDVYRQDSVALMDAQWAPYLHRTNDVFPSLREFDSVAVVGVTSSFPAEPTKAWGKIGAKQCARLEATLARCAGKFVCLLLHHPPTRHHVSDRKALIDDVLLQPILARHPVPLVLHGHIHENTHVDAIDRVRIYSTASASSASVDRPAAYRVFDIDRDERGWNVRMALRIPGDPEVETAATDAWCHDSD